MVTSTPFSINIYIELAHTGKSQSARLYTGQIYGLEPVSFESMSPSRYIYLIYRLGISECFY
jgi:hypothetical protein